MMTSEHIDLTGLASRWGVTKPTARQYTRQLGFPEAIELSARRRLWIIEEVKAWEAKRRVRPLRRQVKPRLTPTTITPIVRAV